MEIYNKKSAGRGRPSRWVKLDDGTDVKLKVWVSTTPEGKAWAKANKKATPVVAQDASPVAPTETVTEPAVS
jgi:hypothetical protein